MPFISREESLKRLRAQIAAGTPIIGAGAGTGISANFLSSPMERCVRDVRVVRQHIMTSSQWIQGAGRVLLGQPPAGFIL